MRLHHIALYCLDLEMMKEFFITHFDCKAGAIYHNPRTGLKTYMLSFPDGDTRMEIMTRPEVAGSVPDKFRQGYIHISISVGTKESVDGKTKELVASQYECIDGPRTTGDGYYESCIVGPEGILIEITV